MPERICSINGCDRTTRARGWCLKHYKRWRKHGDPLFTQKVMGGDEERFWFYVDQNGPISEHRPDLGPCWTWNGHCDERGYARMSAKGSTNYLVHKYAYELLVGPVPEGLELDHLCRNRGCARPSHLEPVTHAENVRRGLSGVLMTHCPNGHERTLDNLYTTPKGIKLCRTCMRERERRYRARKGVAA